MKVKKINPEQCKPLRHLVLWPHIEHEKDCNIDIDSREDAIHIGAFLENEIVSICSLFKMSNSELPHKNQYRLRAMATHPEARGKQAGKAVIEFALQCVKDLKSDVLWCDAREVALGFYQKQGFKIKGDFYNVRNIGPHKLMYFPLQGKADKN